MRIEDYEDKTFRLPPGFLEATVPVPAIWDYHMEHSSHHPVFVYDNGPNDIRTITWFQAGRAIHRAARFVSLSVAEYDIPSDLHSPAVIAILAIKDTITYWTLLAGIMRAGYHAFAISPRNSSAAVTHLLKATDCKMLLVSEDNRMRDLSQDALKNVERKVITLDAPHFNDFFLREEEATFEALPTFKVTSMDNPVMTLHSSGSTDFPKPIVISHRALARWCLIGHYGKGDFCGKIISTQTVPMFHTMGVIYNIGLPTGSGLVCGVFRPQSPPTVPTPDTILVAALALNCQYMVVVPSILEEWSQSEESLESLKTLEVIFFGGGPLSESTGNLLVQHGIRIRLGYGSTEAGDIGFGIDYLGEDWRYFKTSSQTSICWKPHGDGLFEPIVLTTSTYAPNVCNIVIDGTPAYATNDLCAPHPTKKGYWTIYGRTDDQIMHSTGEKTNPGPIEMIIARHPLVRACTMFGRGRFQAGILIDPAFAEQFDPTDLRKLHQFRNMIWPQIEKANEFAPQHSRLFKEMVLVANPMKPFLYTAKGTVRRQAVVQLYDEEINAVYKAVEDSSQYDALLPESWEVKPAIAFVRALIEKILKKSIDDNDDVFQYGADSLQATHIRLSIVQAFKDTNQKTGELAQNLVYAHPTIESLGRFISESVTGKMYGSAALSSSVALEMVKMVEKYTRAFPKHTSIRPIPTEEVVLITGTTGSLGTYLLDKAIASPSIHRVYALNRPAKDIATSLRERQLHAFHTHGVELSLMVSPKLVLLEGDTSLPDLGLSKEQIDEIVRSVTSIIHNAWRVDFNVPLSTFKPLVAGVRKLIDLALSSPFSTPPAIIFTSSVAVVSGWTGQGSVPEAALEKPDAALSNGYSQSKWVAERILDAANQKASMCNVVVRVGQLCGSTVNGSWNQWEWFPSIVQSYKLVGCLPDVAGMITWIPVDIAAAAVLQMRSSSASYLHLAHPKPVAWSWIISHIAKLLNIPVVSYKEWLAKVNVVHEEVAISSTADQLEAARENPALLLVDFYRSALGPEALDGGTEVEAFSRVKLDIEVARRTVKTLGEPGLPALGTEDAQRWLAYWGLVSVEQKASSTKTYF